MAPQKARSRSKVGQGQQQQLSEPDEGKMIKLAMQTLSEHYVMHRGRGRRAARVLGHQLGTDLASSFVSSSDLFSVIEEFAKFWKENGIGDVAWHSKQDRKLVIHSYIATQDEGEEGHPFEDKQMLCPFEEGLLEALLKKTLSEQISVKEITCAGKQEADCVFKITRIE